MPEMMKTPEEIKRGLECGNCDGCPYARWDEKTGQFADHHCEFVETDALAYIQQLEQDNAQKDERIRQLEREKDDLGKELDKMRLSFAQQTARVAEHDCEMLKAVQKAISNLPRMISVEERLPESGVHVLVTAKTPGGHKYVCDAFHAEKFSISSEYGDELACEYNPEKDEYFLEEGWYEVIKNWDDYSSIVIQDQVTHWMPLPEPPEEE